MSAFSQIKNELIKRDWDRSEADAQASAYTSLLTDEEDESGLADDQVIEACEQIENWTPGDAY